MKPENSRSAPADAGGAVRTSYFDEKDYSKGILLLIWGRVVFLLLLSASVIVFNYANLVPPNSPETKALVSSISIYLVLSILYFLYFYKIRKHLYWLAFVQILLDIPLWAVLVTLTGGADSYFVFLFHSSILIAAVYCGGRGILFSLILGISLYILQALMEPAELVPMSLRPFAVLVQHDPASFIYGIGLDVGSMVLVAVLTGFLVMRASKVGKELERTEAIFKDLNKLNEAIISLVPSGIITVDNAGRIKTVNQQARKMLGLEQKRWEDADITILMDLSREELAEPGVSKRISLGSAGDERIYDCTVSPLRDAGGGRGGSVIHMLDITEMLAMQEELAKMERVSALGNLAVGLAHEIRNPLGSISGSVEMIMKDSSLGEDDKKLLQIAVKEARRINNLVDSLLRLSREEVKLNFTTFSLRDLADEVVAMFKASEEASGMTFAVNIAPDLRVEADRDAVGQVLFNLIKNGAEAMAAKEGGELRLEAEERGGEKIEVRVIDEGTGIEPSDVEKIFDFHFTTKNWGIGVGLSVCRQIILKHGETIGCRSGNGKGSTFYFSLRRGDRL